MEGNAKGWKKFLLFGLIAGLVAAVLGKSKHSSSSDARASDNRSLFQGRQISPRQERRESARAPESRSGEEISPPAVVDKVEPKAPPLDEGREPHDQESGLKEEPVTQPETPIGPDAGNDPIPEPPRRGPESSIKRKDYSTNPHLAREAVLRDLDNGDISPDKAKALLMIVDDEISRANAPAPPPPTPPANSQRSASASATPPQNGSRTNPNFLLALVGLCLLGLVAIIALLTGFSVSSGEGGNPKSALADAGGTATPDTGKSGGGGVTPTTSPSTSSASTAACRLDVVGPWSEINGAQPYRIEVGGGDVQHMDYYPLIGVQSVSYIVPPLKQGGVAAKWYGYGQMWQGNATDCANFDYVKDAVGYALSNESGQPGRVQQGHSGLVIDLRGGDFKIVNKPAGWTDDQINALIACDKAGMGQVAPASACSTVMFNGASSSSSSSSSTTPTGKSSDNSSSGSNDQGTSNGGSCQAVRWEDVNRTGPDTVATIGGDGHAYVFELWNPAVQGGTQMKVLIPAGSGPRTFTGFGGAVWQYPTTCTSAQVQQDYDKNPHPAYTN